MTSETRVQHPATGHELPWVVSSGNPRLIVGMNGKGYGVGEVLSPELAEFICRAVNSFDDLGWCVAEIIERQTDVADLLHSMQSTITRARGED